LHPVLAQAFDTVLIELLDRREAKSIKHISAFSLYCNAAAYFSCLKSRKIMKAISEVI